MARTKGFDTEDALNKAVNLFWCKGFHGASMQDVVDHVGLSRSSLYDTFTDKRQLYLEALKKYRREMAGGLIQMIEQSSDIRTVLSSILRVAVEESLQDKQHKGCFMVNSAIELAPHDAEIAALVNANMQDIEDALFEAIRKGQSNGQIATSHHARALARFLFNTISGIRVAAKYGADTQVFDDIVKVALSVL